MTDHETSNPITIISWHRGLLILSAVSSTILIAMGGILCVTHFIRTCPDWPGCFGRIVPPASTGAILEYTHRVLAAISAIAILSTAIVGLIRTPRLRWLVVPPWISILLLLEVSYFGAQVVLRGLSPGWAAVDVGSALLVVALMVTSMVIGLAINKRPDGVIKFSFKSRKGSLALATTAVVYIILVSGVLVAGNNSITGCLGWPIYSLRLFETDVHSLLKTSRMILSLVGIGLIFALLYRSWRARQTQPTAYRIARWVGILLVIEALFQVLLLIFAFPVYLLIGYTITMAAFWAMLVSLLVQLGLQTNPA